MVERHLLIPFPWGFPLSCPSREVDLVCNVGNSTERIDDATVLELAGNNLRNPLENMIWFGSKVVTVQLYSTPVTTLLTSIELKIFVIKTGR
ncbi:hypothetical protein TNCV_3523611 [Trichonephila clavipes]|nr:hypothetical protein TNCV_3523611 [Trichonephila clavipes]